MKQKPLVMAVIVVLAVLGFAFWYWQSKKATPMVPTTNVPAPTLGGTIFENTQSPLKGQVPDTNPFKAQKNPLDAIYQNPFK